MKKNKDKLYSIPLDAENVNATCDFQGCQSSAVQLLNGVGLCPTHFCNFAPDAHRQEIERMMEKILKLQQMYDKEAKERDEAHQAALAEKDKQYRQLLSQFGLALVEDDKELPKGN